MSRKLEVGGQLEVKVEKIVPGGFGLAFAENLTVFVALAAPGDNLLVRVNQKKGKVAFAEIVEILKPSAQRTEPECPYFGKCGGCDFQQMTYAAQLEEKAVIIRDCLTRIGKINFEREISVIGSPKVYRYRSRAQWHADTRARKIGYFARHSHHVIDVEICPILAPELQKTLTRFRSELNWDEFWAQNAEIEAAAGNNSNGDGTQISVYSGELIEPTMEISFDTGENRYFYDAESFFQGNQLLIPELIETATKDASGETALDLYCGVGLFTLPLARRFKNVRGVEGSGKAIGFARKNVENARLENVEFFSANVSEFLNEKSEELKNLDFVLLDPPRAGAEKETIETLLEIKPRQISYVSCDPATLARDLRLLSENIYTIESITALDLFPQTHHVETVARLQLNS